MTKTDWRSLYGGIESRSPGYESGVAYHGDDGGSRRSFGRGLSELYRDDEVASKAEPGLQMPVTERDHRLNADRSSVRLNPSASKTATLSVKEIGSADHARQVDLLGRFKGYLTMLAGTRAGTTACDLSNVQADLKSGPWSARARGGEVAISDGRFTLSINARGGGVQVSSTDPGHQDPLQRTRFLLEAFGELMAQGLEPGKAPDASKIPLQAAQLYLALLGPAGALAQVKVVEGERLNKPLLIAWDLNGTVENGRGFRPGMQETTEALNAMGAVNAITTTVSPESAESLLTRGQIPFGAYFGGSEVRPSHGNKEYEGPAAAFGLSPEQAKDQLVVVGDSHTDQPKNPPGVLFIHDGADTPAEAIQIIIHALDQKGRGSIAKAVDQLLAESRGQAVEVSFGPISATLSRQAIKEERSFGSSFSSFSFSRREESPRASGTPSPVLDRVKIGFTHQSLIDALKTKPAPGAVNSAAIFRLGVYAMNHLSESVMLSTLQALTPATDVGAIAGAVAERKAARKHEIASAHHQLGLLSRMLESPVSFEKLEREFRKVAHMGDEASAQSLRGLVSGFDQVMSRAQKAAEAQLVRDASKLSELAQGLGEEELKSVPMYRRSEGYESSSLGRSSGLGGLGGSRYGGGGGGLRGYRGYGDEDEDLVLETLKGDALPLDTEDRERLREAIREARHARDSETKAALRALPGRIQAALVDRKAELASVFQARVERAGELRTIAGEAEATAADRARTWQGIDSALARLEAGGRA